MWFKIWVFRSYSEKKEKEKELYKSESTKNMLILLFYSKTSILERYLISKNVLDFRMQIFSSVFQASVMYCVIGIKVWKTLL